MREDEPDAIGVFVFGSYAQGTAEQSSDLDLQIVTLAARRIPYRTWFVGDVHVSAGAKSTDELRRLRSIPAGWSLGFAVEGPASGCGRPRRPSRPSATRRASRIRRASPGSRTSSSGARRRSVPRIRSRFASRRTGWQRRRRCCCSDLNAPLTVRNRVEAVRAALELAVAPDGWSDDLATLLALAPADAARLRQAAERLARGVLALLRERAPDVDPQPELGRYLIDGTLERHLGLA